MTKSKSAPTKNQEKPTHLGIILLLIMAAVLLVGKKVVEYQTIGGFAALAWAAWAIIVRLFEEKKVKKEN